MEYVVKHAAASAVAACVYVIGIQAAPAQSAPSRADILGIKLGDSATTAKQTITSSFPGAQPFDVSTTLSVPGNKQTYTIGTLFDINSADEKQANAATGAADAQELDAKRKAGLGTGNGLEKRAAQTGDFGRDRLAVLWYAGADGAATTVYGIGRAKEFLAAERPAASETVASFIQKYGQPVLATKPERFSPFQYLFWASNAGVDRQRCLKTNQSPMLYEDAGFASINTVQYNAETTRTFFLGEVNNFHNHNPLSDVSRCGVVLRAELDLTDDLAFVKKLNESLVDLTKGQEALTALANGFFGGVAAPKPGATPKL